MKRKVKHLLLWALGFSAAACGDDPQVCMYGTPHVDLTASGRVTDTEGVPIPGIEISRMSPEGGAAGPVASTDAEGRYELTASAFPGEPLCLRFTDVDGEANGGDFASQDLTLEFTAEDRVKKGEGWNQGSYLRRDVDVRLECRPDGEPAEEE